MEGCKCQRCGEQYTVDLIVPNELWEKIKPRWQPEGAGLLCGSCIMTRVERLSDFGAWHLTATPK